MFAGMRAIHRDGHSSGELEFRYCFGSGWDFSPPNFDILFKRVPRAHSVVARYLLEGDRSEVRCLCSGDVF